MTKRVFVCAWLVLGLGASAASASSMVVNGGFETGDFSGWAVSVVGVPPCGPPEVSPNGGTICGGAYPVAPSHSGNYAAELTTYNSDAFLDQNLFTEAGGTYELRFWLSNIAINGQILPNHFNLSWNGAVIFSATDMPAFAYTEYVFSGLVASGPLTQLRFGGVRQDPGYFQLDDVTVNAVPEPATLLLLGSGLVGAARRFRKRAN